jgi:hypothetical protein
VSGAAWVYGAAQVSGDAWVSGAAQVSFGFYKEKTETTDEKYIAASLNVYPIGGAYLLYKRVNKIKDGEYASCHDSDFIYKDKTVAEVNNVCEDKTTSCGTGIHVSTPFYWTKGDTLIAVSVRKEDIICCLEGKIRARRVSVIGEIKQ